MRLKGADLDVVARHVADQRDEHVVISRDRGEIGGVGRLDAVAELTPQIKLPFGVRVSGKSHSGPPALLFKVCRNNHFNLTGEHGISLRQLDSGECAVTPDPASARTSP